MTEATTLPPTAVTALTVPNPLPAAIVALSEEARGQLGQALVNLDMAITIHGGEGWYDAASAIAKDAQKALKALEGDRKAVKAPVLELGKQIDAVAAEAAAPLVERLAKLNQMLAEEYKKLEAARQAALAERRRLEDEARAEKARIEAEQKAAAAAAAAARAEFDADDMMADLLGEERPEPPRVPDPVVQAPAPTVIVPPAPEKIRAAVRMVKKYTLEVIDARKVPRVMQDAEGNAYQLVVLDEAAITRAMKAGVQVPGCVLHTEEVPASMGR